MEVKKTEGANLENKRLLFVELGLILALALTFGAFSWSTKEKQAAVRGRIQTSSYETKDGEKRYTFDVIAEQVTFLSPKSDSVEQSAPDGFREYNEEDDEDVPF